jgi:FAD/FMN-containing dehydrogenase
MPNPIAARIATQWSSRFDGRLLKLTDSEYAVARRVWNGMIDREPALIVRCATPNDIRTAVKLARAERLPVSVKGGGHSVAGTAVCDGGLMIDLSPMKQIRVDPVAKEAIAAPGLLWGEFDAATQAHGLATTGGQVSHTGIAGLTLGGGLGYLMGKHGAVCDNLLSVELVTAEGEFLHASPEENSELFWAMRGAGANFGIVTSFRYRLHPLEETLSGMLLYPRERTEEVMAFYQEFIKGTPDELDTTLGFLNSPDGGPLFGIIAVYAGPVRIGEQLLAPLRKFGSPVADLIRPMQYTEVQSMVDNAVPVGDRYYWKSNFLHELAPGLGAVLRDGANAMPSPRSMILVFEIKGQIRRVPKDAMAFDHRDFGHEMSIIGHWGEPAEDAANIQWTRNVWTAAQPFVAPAVYANHMAGDEPPERIRKAYGQEKFARLAALKQKYDPDNFFRLNHNIPPAG